MDIDGKHTGNDTATWPEIFAARRGCSFQKRAHTSQTLWQWPAATKKTIFFILYKTICVEFSTCWVHGIFYALCKGFMFGTISLIRRVLAPWVLGVASKPCGPQMPAHKCANTSGHDMYVRLDMWFLSICISRSMFSEICEIAKLKPVMRSLLLQ